MDAITLPRADELASIDPHDVIDAYATLGLDELSDAALIGRCAAIVDRPKVAEPDSFVLHAPLELMARAALLAQVLPEERAVARRRLVWFAATYAAAGEEVAAPAGVPGFSDPAGAVAALGAAVTAGDLDAADASMAWLAEHVGVVDLVQALVDLVAPSLAGAAHGGIFLHQVLSHGAAPGARSFARELARNPDWRLTWFGDRSTGGRSTGGPSTGIAVGSVDGLMAALRRPPSPGPLDSNFIFPTMHLTESSGLAASVLGPALAGVDRSAAASALLRVAALSMVQDDATQAPYGWSHCLTMPLGVLAVAPLAARPDDVLAVAATYVLGFRATLGQVDLDPAWVPDRPVDTVAALDGTPAEAAAGAWHAAPDNERGAVAARLASRAAAHPDAHLAKYTLACLQQAAADPAAAHLYLAAAAFLGAWWRAHPVGGDPLV